MMLLGNINAIPFRRRRFGGGGDTPFPSISGMIARYSALGLTNEQMAANPVWKDLTGNGHDLQMKNFAWGGMSGVGGYGDENYQTFYKFTLNNYVFIASPPGVEHMNFTFRVTGLQPGNKLTLAFFGTTKTVYGRWDKDGIYTVDADIVEAGKPTYFYNGYKATRGEFTIEILPLYPGALVFDGVDDCGTCDNFPILTKEKGYTVVALRQYLVEKSTAYLTANGDSISNTSFIFEGNNYKDTWNFGRVSPIQASRILATQTSKQYDGVKLNIGTNAEGSNLLQVGKWSKSYSNVAIWELVFLDHDATEEELTKIKDYFVKTYPWLFPDQAWTVVGKTNEDTDRATIANITGNGNNLVLSNFGFAENSGYGLYGANYSGSRWFINSSITATKKADSFKITSISQVAVQLQYIDEPSQSPYAVPSYTIRVTGLTDGQTVNYRVSGGISYPITQDGVYTLPGFDFAGMGSWYGFQFNKIQESCDITIEQIPEYEGYLVTDGVDDEARSAAFTLNEDWTIVGDWELLSNVQINCGIVKAQNVYLYNAANGLLVSINNPRSLQSFGTKSLHAICSDGRLYDRNWVEYEYTVDQNFEIVKSSLNIGFNLNNHTQIAFKNLGIYNNQILSKDDCIKAYNYLQTLKAK